MKFIGRISLFLLLTATSFLAGAYVNSRYLLWFYPNSRILEEETEFFREEKNIEPMEHPVSSNLENIVTCDTIFEIEELDEKTGITSVHQEDIPGKYIGMDRNAFLDAMDSYQLSPPLEEKRRGLLTVEVLSFSAQKILLRKSYFFEPKLPKEVNFYLVAEDNYVTVYTQDMTDIHMYTDIRLDRLPETLQEEIIQKKLICGEDNLYHFLESYSS